MDGGATPYQPALHCRLARLVKDFDTETAGLCLDTGHLAYAGTDPVATLRSYGGRLDSIHFRDIDPVVFKQMMSERIQVFDGCARGVMSLVGKGAIDYAAVLTTLSELGYAGYITIGQERDPGNLASMLDGLAASRTFLSRIGL
jgi:inosose dehydratase